MSAAAVPPSRSTIDCPPVRMTVDDLDRACRGWVQAGSTKPVRHRRRVAARLLRGDLPYVAERVDRGKYYFEAPVPRRTVDGRTVAVSPPTQSIVLSALAKEITETKGIDKRLQAACGGLPPGRGPQHGVWWLRLLLGMASASSSEGVATLAAVDVKSAYPSLSPVFAVRHARDLGVRGDVLDGCAAFLDLVNRSPLFPGLPPGAPISAPLAEIALEPIDAALAVDAYEIVRFVDNLAVVFAGLRPEPEVRSIVDRALDGYEETSGTRLALHDWQIVAYDRERGVDRGFTWLGYQFMGRALGPAARTLARFSARLRAKAPLDPEPSLRGLLSYYRPVVDAGTLDEIERDLRAQTSATNSRQ